MNEGININRAPWFEEMTEDEKTFNAVGYYRGRVGETFVSTQQQFNEWDIGTHRTVEFDKLELFDKNSEIPEEMFLLEEGENVQGEFDEQSDRERKGFKGSKGQKLDRMEFDRVLEVDFYNDDFRKRPSADRQPGSKRKSREMRRLRQDKHNRADSITA